MHLNLKSNRKRAEKEMSKCSKGREDLRVTSASFWWPWCLDRGSRPRCDTRSGDKPGQDPFGSLTSLREGQREKIVAWLGLLLTQGRSQTSCCRDTSCPWPPGVAPLASSIDEQEKEKIVIWLPYTRTEPAALFPLVLLLIPWLPFQARSDSSSWKKMTIWWFLKVE